MWPQHLHTHLKLNQKLKYLNSDSMYIHSYFKSISTINVLKWLSKLLTRTQEHQYNLMDKLYLLQIKSAKHCKSSSAENTNIKAKNQHKHRQFNQENQSIKRQDSISPSHLLLKWFIYFRSGYSKILT